MNGDFFEKNRKTFKKMQKYLKNDLKNIESVTILDFVHLSRR